MAEIVNVQEEVVVLALLVLEVLLVPMAASETRETKGLQEKRGLKAHQEKRAVSPQLSSTRTAQRNRHLQQRRMFCLTQ